MTDWKTLRETLRKERGGLCECGCGEEWTDCHHMLIHRMKDRPWLDCRENIMVLNHSCHMSNRLSGYKSRVEFWKVQCVRYGEEHMLEWLDRIPLKVKPRFG
jgi:hypothetical protein